MTTFGSAGQNEFAVRGHFEKRAVAEIGAGTKDLEGRGGVIRGGDNGGPNGDAGGDGWCL